MGFGIVWPQADRGLGAQETVPLLRLLAVAAPLVVLNNMWFAHLRVRKLMGRLVLACSILALFTLGVTGVWVRRFGIAASGVGWLIGNGLVVIVAAFALWKDVSEIWDQQRS